jgi:hypothetical protein
MRRELFGASQHLPWAAMEATTDVVVGAPSFSILAEWSRAEALDPANNTDKSATPGKHGVGPRPRGRRR